MSKRIAMLYMSPKDSDIKTHIYELSKELRREGNDVTIISNGGADASLLKDDAIPYIKAPLHSKSPIALFRSYSILLNEFKKNRPSIVHSQANVCHLIPKIICRQLRIPLVIDATAFHSGKDITQIATDAIESYNNAINRLRPMDYIISGYYGKNNFGDDLTLHGLMNHLKGYRGTVLTCDPQNTAVPPNVELIHRFDLWKIRKAMKNSKVFLFGSGSILQDSTSNRSVFYYYFIMKMALLYHCKTMLYANGIGPLAKKSNCKNVARILKEIDLITLRDEDSMKLLNELQPNRNAFLTQDDAFSYDVHSISAITTPAQAQGKTIVGVNFKFKNEQDPKIQSIAQALQVLAEKHQLYYYLIPYHSLQDIRPLQALHQELKGCSELVSKADNPESIIAHAAGCKYQIVERLHGQIISTMLAQPFLPIDYDPKTKAFAAQTGMNEYRIHHNELEKTRLIENFEKIINRREEISARLLEFSKKAKKDAALNREHLYQIIKDI